jgi:plastocyanin
MAFDAKSGMNLWEFQLGSGADGPVVTYEVDGEQHIAIAAREAIWSLKLNGKLEELAPQPAAPTVTSFVGTIEDADQVVLGSTLSDGGLNGKRTEPDPYGLEPQRARTEAGGTLKFINKTDLPHHLKALDGSWDTGVIKAGESRSIKFTQAGVTTYICVDHPWTYGEVTIE